MKVFADSNRRAVLGWVMYDWANSAFATTVLAAFFPIFFRQYWSGGAFATAKLGMGNALAGLLIAVLSPVLGAFGDAGNRRKRFLGTFMMCGAFMTALLPFVAQGAWKLALACFVLANVGWSWANLFYDSLLPSVAPKGKLDFTSSLGYSIGYLGGGLLFLLNIFMLRNPASFGLEDTTHAVRVSFWMVSVWWAIFSLPLLFLVQEKGEKIKIDALRMVRDGFRELADTFAHIRQLRHVWFFLVAYWLYIDGVDTFIRMAADLGMSIGLESGDLVVSLLVVQLVAFPCALISGLVAQKIGAIRTIMIGIGIYAFVTAVGPFWVHHQWQYTLLAAVTALPMGALQALSRSYYAGIIPADKSAEFFGFYNLMGKFAAIVGPALVGGVSLIVVTAGGNDGTAGRVGFCSVTILFVLGAIFLHVATRKDVAAPVEGVEHHGG